MTASDGVFVHIGLAKTGSTTLQWNYFSKARRIVYLGKNSGDEAVDQAGKKLTRLQPEDFVWEDVKRVFDARRDGMKGVPLYSEEDITIWKFFHPKEMGRRIGKVLPHPRLIYVVRRPTQWVLSQYYFRLWTLRSDTFKGPNQYLEKHLSQLKVGSDVAEIQFTETFEFVRSSSRADDQLILPHEMMVNQRREFLERIETFMGVAGALTRIYDKGEPRSKKIRLGRQQSNYIRALSLWEREREQFLEVARSLSTHGGPEHTAEFAALTSNPNARFEDWVEWFRRGRRAAFQAIEREDQALIGALPQFDDYQIRPGLMAHVLEVEQQETAAMRERFGVDLAPYGYGTPA